METAPTSSTHGQGRGRALMPLLASRRPGAVGARPAAEGGGSSGQEETTPPPPPQAAPASQETSPDQPLTIPMAAPQVSIMNVGAHAKNIYFQEKHTHKKKQKI